MSYITHTLQVESARTDDDDWGHWSSEGKKAGKIKY